MRSICAACWQRDCKQCWCSCRRWEKKPRRRRASECFSYHVRCKWKLKCFGIQYFLWSRSSFLNIYIYFFFYRLIFFHLLSHKHITQYRATDSNPVSIKMKRCSVSALRDGQASRRNHLTTSLTPHTSTRRQEFKSEACFVSLNQDRLQIRLPSTLSSLLLFKIWVAFTSTATWEVVRVLYLK